VPYVVTIHDLIPMLYQPTLRHSIYFQSFLRGAARRARKVLTVSSYTKHEIIQHYELPEDHIVVTHNGVEPRFSPGPPTGEPYLLVMGNPRPHKNLAQALKVYEALDLDLPLLLVSSGDPSVKACSKKVDHRTYVDDADLPALYRSARVFFYPSLYEGFGLPVLEAMACGAVVVCSDATSLPEVLGDGGLKVDARDVTACADAVRRACTDESLRAELSAKAVRQAAKFTWDACARQTLDVYRKISPT
jgi:glycosyltransferase involved in cell wall biosynthesis